MSLREINIEDHEIQLTNKLDILLFKIRSNIDIWFI